MKIADPIMPITSTNGLGQEDDITYLSILDSNSYILARYIDFKILPVKNKFYFNQITHNLQIKLLKRLK